jgi:hypothetical protein
LRPYWQYLLLSDKFAQFDLNQDGILTLDEWLHGKKQEEGSGKGLIEHWRKFDQENNGFLTLQEANEKKAWARLAIMEVSECIQYEE